MPLPAIIPVIAPTLTAVAIAAMIWLGYQWLGPNASEQRKECVERMVEALKPGTPDGVKDIVRQCKERYD